MNRGAQAWRMGAKGAKVALGIALGSALAPLAAFAEREIPALSGPVIDETGRLRPQEVQALSRELYSYLPKLQLQIWMVNSLEGEPIESLSMRAVEKWKFGSAKDDQGAMILVALQDRKMRIEVGQGLEGMITDLLAGRIIRNILAPSFKAGQFYEGLTLASQAIHKKSQGIELRDTDFTGTSRRGKVPKWVVFVFVLAFYIFIVLPTFIARRALSQAHGRARPLRQNTTSFWSGGNSSGGGGGGWSGGGGGFSGGGSSGGW